MKNEELMKKAADIINEEFSEQVAVYEKIDVEIPQEQDEMLLEMARKADRERKNREKIRRKKKRMHIVAVFLISIIAFSVITIGVSEAFRMRLFDIFRDDDKGSLTLKNDTLSEAVQDWDEFWYPQYLPEGYFLETAEKNENESIMLFLSENTTNEIRIRQLKLGSIAYDKYQKEKIEIIEGAEAVSVGEYEGVYLFDNESGIIFIVWKTEDALLEIRFSSQADRQTALMIAESMMYIE